MKVTLGFKPGVFNALIQVPDLFTVILQYMDCSALFALTMTNKKLFGLFNESSIDELVQASEASTEVLNVVTMDPNLWLNLVLNYEERLRKLKLNFNTNDYYQYYPMNVKDVREFTELMKKKETEKSNVKTSNIREKLEIVVDCTKKLKKLYSECWKQQNPEEYGIEVSKSGRSSCKTCFKPIQYGVLRGYQNNHETYYKAHECHHLSCFLKLLLTENVPEEYVLFESVTQKETISKIYELIGKEKKAIQKAKWQSITCDNCNVLVNGNTYMSSEKANMDLCGNCFTTNTELVSVTSEKHGPFVPTQKPFLKCRYCKEQISRVLFNCHQCNISFCGKCLTDLRWFEHKNHFINVIGNALDEELKCLTSDFKPEDKKPLPFDAYNRFSADDLLEEFLAEIKRDKAAAQSIPNKKKRPLPKLEPIPKPTRSEFKQSSNLLTSNTQPKNVNINKPLEAPKKQTSVSKPAQPQQASSSNSTHHKPIAPPSKCSTSKKRVLIELSSDEESGENEIEPKKFEAITGSKEVPEILKSSKPSKQVEPAKKKSKQDKSTKETKKKTKKKKQTEESSESEDEIYLVEKLLDRKIVRGKPYYLVKWEGYRSSDNSWEPKENISPDLIKEFEEDLVDTKPRVAKKKK